MKPVKNLTGSQVLMIAKVYITNAAILTGDGAHVGDNATYRSLRARGYLVGTLGGGDVWVTSGTAGSMGLPWPRYLLSTGEIGMLDALFQNGRINAVLNDDALAVKQLERLCRLGFAVKARLSPGYYSYTPAKTPERLGEIKAIFIYQRVPIIDAYGFDEIEVPA